jgi:hypothetical protein
MQEQGSLGKQVNAMPVTLDTNMVHATASSHWNRVVIPPEAGVTSGEMTALGHWLLLLSHTMLLSAVVPYQP